MVAHTETPVGVGIPRNMKMPLLELTSPVVITPRLMAGVKVGNPQEGGGWISVQNHQSGEFRYRIDIAGYEYDGRDISSACGRLSLQDGLRSVLAFLDAASEAYRTVVSGGFSDNSGMFPPNVEEWAYMNSDEIGMLACELEETKGLIKES